MIEANAIGVVQEALKTVVYAAAPPLLMGLVVGVIVSIFQTVTSIQEPTLAFVPKILAVFMAIFLFGKWMMDIISGFTMTIFENLPSYLAMFFLR